MQILAKLHHDEPVSKPEFGHNQSYVLSSTWPGVSTKYQVPGASWHHGDHPDEEVDECPANEEEVPEPEKDINFLIDNIKR